MDAIKKALFEKALEKEQTYNDADYFMQPAFIRFLMRHPTGTTIVSAVLGSLLAALLVTLLEMLLQ